LQLILRLVGSQKPEEIFAMLQKRCPDVFEAAAAEANKGPEPVTVASARKAFAEATKVFKELVTKREHLTSKVGTQTKQLAASQSELDDTIGKLAEAKDAQAACATALELAGQAQGPEEGTGPAAVRQGDGEEEDDVGFDEEPSPQEKEALDKLHEALGPDNDKKKLLDDFILVAAKRRKKNSGRASPREAMEIGAAEAALVEAAAKIAKHAAAEAAAAAKAALGK
jgi:hypothetical protein